MAVLEPKQITCSLWKPETCSPPLKENESLVSNVIELLCEHGPPSAQFSKDNDKKIMIMLSHSATDLVGYELVIKELVDQDNNEWIDLETRNIWKESGRISCDCMCNWDLPAVTLKLVCVFTRLKSK